MVNGSPCFQARHRGGGKWPTDGYVARLSADGSTLKAATYFGGTETEQMSGIDLDEAVEIVNHYGNVTTAKNWFTLKKEV